MAWGGPALLSNLPQRALWEVPGWGWCIWPGPALQPDGGDVLNAVAAHPEQLTYYKPTVMRVGASEGGGGGAGQGTNSVSAHLFLPQ